MVMPMYHLIEYGDNYSKTSENLWQYYKDIPAVNRNAEIVDLGEANLTEAFYFKAKMAGQTGDNGTKKVEIMVPLKFLSNFWRPLGMSLVNCELNLILTWSADFVIVSANNANQGATYAINETKLYVAAVTLSTQYNVKLLQLKRTIKWKKITSKLELLRQNRNWNDLVESSFQGINRPFVLSFEIDAQRISSKRYCIPNVEIKVYDVVIDGNNFFEQPINNDKITYEKIKKFDTGQENDYTTPSLANYSYFKENYNIIAIELSKQQALDADPKAIKQIKFTANIDRAGDKRMFFIFKETKQNVLDISQWTVRVL